MGISPRSRKKIPLRASPLSSEERVVKLKLLINSSHLRFFFCRGGKNLSHEHTHFTNLSRTCITFSRGSWHIHTKLESPHIWKLAAWTRLLVIWLRLPKAESTSATSISLGSITQNSWIVRWAGHSKLLSLQSCKQNSHSLNQRQQHPTNNC